MEGFKLFKQGAEARIYEGCYLGRPALIKERFRKTYRHQHLDDSLTKERIKAETRAIVKCKTIGLKTPMLLLVDFDRRMIIMEHYQQSVVLKNYIEQANEDQIMSIAVKIGQLLGQMHAGGIVHGDLTSSNMLVDDDQLMLIDFGLASTDPTSEDKGVDLYVLERALLSTHKQAEKMWPHILQGYKQTNKGWREVMGKYEEVRARGRKRTMIG